MRRSLALLALLSSAGCTIEDGVGFAHLSGRLWSTFAGLDSKSGRHTPDGWFKTDNSFSFKLSTLQIRVRDIRLQGSALSTGSAGSGDCTFDPANPPSGCSLCHNGHCHCNGQLKSYEELKKEVCGGSSGQSLSTVGALLVNELQSLLGAGTKAENLACQGSCELGQGQASQAQIVLDRIMMQAALQDKSVANRLAGKELQVSLDLDLAGAALTHSFPAAQLMDRQNPYHIDLMVLLSVSERLLDGVQWEKLSCFADAITIDSKSNLTAGEAILTNLALTKPGVQVERFDD